MAAVPPLQAPTEAEESLLPAKELQGSQPAPSTSSVFKNLQPLETRAGAPQAPSTPAPLPTSSPTQDAGTPQDDTAQVIPTPRSTAWHRRKLQLQQEAAAKEGVSLKVRAYSVNICSSCGVRKIKQMGHRLLRKASGERVSYCPVAAKGQRPEERLASL